MPANRFTPYAFTRYQRAHAKRMLRTALLQTLAGCGLGALCALTLLAALLNTHMH